MSKISQTLEVVCKQKRIENIRSLLGSPHLMAVICKANTGALLILPTNLSAEGAAPSNFPYRHSVSGGARATRRPRRGAAGCARPAATAPSAAGPGPPCRSRRTARTGKRARRPTRSRSAWWPLGWRRGRGPSGTTETLGFRAARRRGAVYSQRQRTSRERARARPARRGPSLAAAGSGIRAEARRRRDRCELRGRPDCHAPRSAATPTGGAAVRAHPPRHAAPRQPQPFYTTSPRLGLPRHNIHHLHNVYMDCYCNTITPTDESASQ